ncbi:hypothetical protein SLS62_008767 [Diatrype stigma]|uniref:Uncharacterized protein n=1 Tax=Diatrype stigma TaxID=117547 RepID=A0AAN9UJQ0_9PEZI
MDTNINSTIFLTTLMNSLLLSRHDRVLLDYFPASTIFCVHSSATKRWSPLRYIQQVTAASSSMVMHMILAYSAGELCRKRKRQQCDSAILTTTTGAGGGMDELEAAELHHYTAAIQELHDCIKSTDADREADHGRSEVAWTRFEDNLEAILCALFIMIHYGLQSMSSLGHARTHVAGLASLVAMYLRVRKKRARRDSPKNERQGQGHGFTALSSLLLLWILYADIAGHTYGLSQDLLSIFMDNDKHNNGHKRLQQQQQLLLPPQPTSTSTQISTSTPTPTLTPTPAPASDPTPTSSLLDLGQLFRDARLGPTTTWGNYTYTIDPQDGNNLMVFRGLEMSHHVQLLRARISKARAATMTDGECGRSNSGSSSMGAETSAYGDYSSLMSELLLLQETYQDVFEWASYGTFAEIKNHIENNSDGTAAILTRATATTTPTTTTTPISAVKLTARHAAEITTKLITHYWAGVLFCRRWLNPNPPSASASEESIRLRAVSSIIARLPPGPSSDPDSESESLLPKDTIKNAKERKEMLIRFAWPTFMAAIETDDAGQRRDLLARLGEVRDESAECQWYWGTAREIARMQTEMQRNARAPSPLGQMPSEYLQARWVDLAQFMQKSHV